MPMAHSFEWMAQRGIPSRRAPSIHSVERWVSRRTLWIRTRLVKAHVVLAWRRLAGSEGPSLARRVQWSFGRLGRATAIRRGTLWAAPAGVADGGRARALWTTTGRRPLHRRRWRSGVEPESLWGP